LKDFLEQYAMTHATKDITALLDNVNQGREEAWDKLLAVAYDELRAGAKRMMRVQVGPGKPGATLQPTALVHEAFLRLIKEGLAYEKRNHFFAIFNTRMMEVLRDAIRRGKAKKRSGGRVRVPLDPDSPKSDHGADFPDLIDVLEKLEKIDARKANVVQLRVFCGLTVTEVSESLGIGHATVERDWKFAKAWLQNELGEYEP